MEENNVIAKPDESPGPEIAPDNGPLANLAQYCIDQFEQFKKSTYRNDKIEEIKESRRTYEQQENPKSQDFPWRKASNITMPLNTITVDNLEPRLVAGLVGTKPVVKFEMEGMSEQDDLTKLTETWYNQELENKVEIETKTMSLVHLVLLEGTTYYIPKYSRKERSKRDFTFGPMGNIIVNPVTGEPVIQDVTIPVYEGGDIENVPFSDVYCADDIGTPEQWEVADKIRVIRPTYGDLMRSRNDVGYFGDKIGPWLLGGKESGELKEENQTPSQQVVGVKYTGKETVECIECYLTYHINKDEDQEESQQTDFTEDQIVVTVHLKTKTIIRLCLQRDLNFENESIIKRVRMFPEENRSFGTSVYGKIKSIQNGATDFFNAILNISYLTMLPWYFYDDESGLSGEKEIVPGKGIAVDNVKGILFPNFSSTPPVYLPFIEMFIQLWERIGSVANPQVGRPADKEKTATEIMMVVQEGNIKFDYQARTSKQEFISILKTLYDLYYQHMPYNATFKYNGKEVPLPRQIMRRGYKFKLVGSTAMANKMLERKESEDLLALAAQVPMVNMVAAVEEVLKSRGKTDLRRWIKPEVSMMMQALAENPELPSAIGNYLKIKQDTADAITPEKGEKMPRKPIELTPAMPGANGGTV